MKLTNAVAGIARSGATRAGYPVLQGALVKLFALSKVARAGATRANYHSTHAFIAINGVQVGWGRAGVGVGVLGESLSIATAINATPATANLIARGFVPVEGSDLVITLGSINNLRREFGGTIISTRHRYVGDKPVAANMVYDIAAVDWMWGLGRRQLSADYKSTTVAAVAAALLTFAPGYTLHVDADIGAERIDEITFTETTPSAAFAQLAKRVGGDYNCDYLKVIKVFYRDSTLAPPTVVNATHKSMNSLTYVRDLSQVITRCLGEFGGSDALDAIAPGETLLPVITAAWYLAAGGVVLSGQQRITYGGLAVGGGGSLVGPGASPTGAPNVTLGTGAGVDVGAHDYAVTYRTAAPGETIAGPRVSVNVGVFLSPTTAPVAGVPGPGVGADPGSHDYAVSFVVSTGETTPGPRMSVSTTFTAPPTTAPNATSVSIGPGPDPGVHDYAVSFLTATGETTLSPIGAQITSGIAMSPPSNGPSGSPGAGVGLTPGARLYAVTFVTAKGETIPGPPSTLTTPPYTAAPTTAMTWGGGTAGGGVLVGAAYPGNNWGWSYTFVTGAGETAPCPARLVIGNAVAGSSIAYSTVTVPTGPTGTIARKVYRTGGYGDQSTPQTAPLGYELTIGHNSPAQITVGLVYTGAPNPDPPTAGSGVMNLTGIQLGGSGTTGRRVYRSIVNGQQLKLVATITDNNYSTYTDTTPDANLGADAPTVNTAGGAQTVTVSNIPIGPVGVTGRWIYRRSGGVGLRFAGGIGDNTTTTYTDTAPNSALGGAPHTVNTASQQQIPITSLPIGNALVTARKLYRTAASGGALKLVATIADNLTTTYLDTTPDANLGAAALAVGTAQAQQVQLTAIPIGAASVIARVIYRTKAGASQLQQCTVINDNTTTTFTDTALDATLGANAPTSDTSLLQQPTGNVLAGSAALPCASVAGFLATGGWAIVGSQNIRYTGITGSGLSGIPATGVGAIAATITYNTTVVAAPMLIKIAASGTGAIKYPILKGDPVNLFVQVDDLAAQAAVRAQIPNSDGIIEDELQDRRLSYTEGRARCLARLAMLGARDSDGKVGIVTVNYIARDLNTQAGTTVSINVGAPMNLRGEYLIQRVNATQFFVPDLNPTYTVEASSVRFSADALLRAVRDAIS